MCPAPALPLDVEAMRARLLQNGTSPFEHPMPNPRQQRKERTQGMICDLSASGAPSCGTPASKQLLGGRTPRCGFPPSLEDAFVSPRSGGLATTMSFTPSPMERPQICPRETPERSIADCFDDAIWKAPARRLPDVKEEEANDQMKSDVRDADGQVPAC